MFERSIDWPKAVAMICDIAKGTVAVSLRSYSGAKAAGLPKVVGWDYHQVQAHGRSEGRLIGLVDPQHLHDTLLSVSTIGSEFYAYEVDGHADYRAEAELLLSEFAGITVTVVGFTVGDVAISWFLVSMDQNRDIIHWKMQYHERNRRPAPAEANA